MEKRAVLFVLVVAIPLWVTARISPSPAECPDDITLSTQAEVNAFATTYDCTELTGVLTISGDDITDLQGLSAITSIGTLHISANNALRNLDGLSNLTTVGNTCSCSMPGLVIEDNPVLTNLQGLTFLSRVDGNLRISGNHQLTDLAGLERITSVGAMLDIDNNATLISINALSAVTSIGIGHLSYQSIRISNNALLTRISIVNGLTSLPGEVMIENNASLTEVNGFSSLTQINGLRANLLITGNARLTNINGFAALTTIIGGGGGGVITISNNAALTNMNGFSSLNRINGGITGGLILSNNQALTEVDGLSQLLSITGGNFYLRVIDNPRLNRGCGLFPLLDNNGVGGDWCDNSTCPAITISGNGPDCTREAILGGGVCLPVVVCPVDKVVIAESTSGCGSHSTKIIIQNPEVNVTYTLRNNQNNSIVAGPLDGTSGLSTGLITITTVFNVLAHSNTGCDVVMSALPIVTINPLPMDYLVVAENSSIMEGTSTNILVQEGEPSVMYTLRKDGDNSIVAGPLAGPPILATGILLETTTYNVHASDETCVKELSTRVTVTVVPAVITGITVNTLANMSFYPNPSNGEFQIQFANNASGQYHLSLHDLAGSLVKEKSIGSLDKYYTAQIDLKPLPVGTYFVSITGPGGIYLRRRLVITN